MEGYTYRCADLDKELAHGGSVVHGVKGRNLVDAHRGHLEHAGDLVHDADAGEAVLALAEVEQGHDGALLVLGGVSLEDLGNDGLILLVELEGDFGVVVGGVSVLWEQRQSSNPSKKQLRGRPRLARGAGAEIGVPMALWEPRGGRL